MKKFVVIVAGGRGTRMNTAVPKQFLLLQGKPVLFYTIDIFFKAYSDIEVILVLPKEFIATGQEIIQSFFPNSTIQVTTGGQTRFHSVKNGLHLVKENSIVFVHDAVRCMISTSLIKRCYEAAVEFGTAVPVIACKDSVRILTGKTNRTIERELVKLVQTPQTFLSNLLLPAFDIEFNEKFTDEATVAEAAGMDIHLIEGEENNLKLTTLVDMEFAEKIIAERNKSSE